jgi:hypothetical protein
MAAVKTGGQTVDEYRIDELRSDVEENIKQFSQHVFNTLKVSGTESILIFLLKVCLEPVLQAYRVGPQSVAELLQTIWPKEFAIFTRLIDEGKLEPENPAEALETLLNQDEYAAHLFEKLILFAEVLPLMEEAFQQQEWVLEGLRHELQAWQRKGKFQELQVTLLSEQYTTPGTSRGDLQIQVSTSKPTNVAGEEFSVFVVISNPFEVPITLYSVETQIPVELIDVAERQRRTAAILKDVTDERARKDEEERRHPPKGLAQLINSMTSFGILNEAVNQVLTQWLLNIRMAGEPENRIAQAVAASEVKQSAKKLDLKIQQDVHNVEAGSVIGAKIDRYQTTDIVIESASTQYLDKLLWRLNAFKQGLTPIILQPGDSVVKQFIFKTKHWLLFTPLAHTMQIQVRFNVDDRDHLDTVPFSLSIQAAITATMIGAVFGGLIGGFARIMTDTKNGAISLQDQIISLMLAVILSAVTVVSFARKSGAQQIVSIEDFWGGLFLGFLIGFLGQNYALNLIAPTPTS